MRREAPATVRPMAAKLALEPSVSLTEGVMEGGREAGRASFRSASTSSPCRGLGGGWENGERGRRGRVGEGCVTDCMSRDINEVLSTVNDTSEVLSPY